MTRLRYATRTRTTHLLCSQGKERAHKLLALAHPLAGEGRSRNGEEAGP